MKNVARVWYHSDRDILTGITAHKRADGEYDVFVEEDYRGKVILYRWKPSLK